ncbi:MAG: universal stress protein [Oricola sp.]
MSFDSILVHMEFDGVSNARLQYATDLAGDLDAYLIGMTAAAHRLTLLGDAINGGAEAEDRSALRARARFSELKREFFDAAGDGQNSAWRQAEDMPTNALLGNATIADLIVSGTPHGADPGDIYRSVDPGELVCGAGRPVLFVGENSVYGHPDCVVIGWKATPEARRAIVFALPLLKLAERAVVLAATEDDAGDAPGLNDVVRYLLRHEVDAEARSVATGGGPEEFVDAVRDFGADLVVTGAFGHGRLRERIFGGVTRSLLMQRDLNRLMAG